MAETYTKLFSSIVRSSVWLEDDQTLRVWVTLLALADRDGYVGASVGGLAHQARVPEQKTREALAKFMAPDPDSRSQEHEGRRIEQADRGWVILNHERFRDMRDEEAVRAYEREKKRRQRAGNSEKTPVVPGQSPSVPKSPPLRSDPDQKSDPEPERESARARVSNESAPVSNQTLAERAQAILDNPHDGKYSRPSKWPEVARIATAMAQGRALRLTDLVTRDGDLRAILEALAAGYTEGDLLKASEAAKSDPWFRNLRGPGPSVFTVTVIRRLLAPPQPPGLTDHQRTKGAPIEAPVFDALAVGRRINEQVAAENERKRAAAHALREANDGK